VRALGVADIFQQTGAAIERNGLTGAALLEYNDLQQLMDDLSISSRLHRHVITAKLDGWRRARGVALQPTSAVLARLQTEADELRAANLKLKAKTDMLDVVDGTLALKEEQQRLREALLAEARALREQNAGLRAKIDEADERREGYGATGSHHDERREQMLQELADERAQVERARAENAALGAAVNEKASALRLDEEKLKDALAKHHAQLAEYAAGRAALAQEIKAEREHGERLRAQQVEIGEKSRKTEAEYKDLAARALSDRDVYETEQKALKQCAEELAADRECLENEAEALKLETAAKVKKLEEAQKAHKTESDRFARERASAAVLVAERERELTATRLKHERALKESADAAADERAEVERMTREKKGFADEIELLRHCLQRQRDTECELRDACEATRDDASRRAEALRVAQGLEAEERAAYEEKRKELLEYLAQARENSARLERQKAEYESQKDAMSAEASAVAARREDNDRRHGGEQSELRKLTAFVDTELDARNAERDRAAEALDQASARLKAELETKADNTEAEVAMQRDELARKERELEYLEATIDQAEKVRHNLEEQAPQKPEIKKKKK